MTITLELPPEIEQGLLTQANAEGMSITKYVEQIVTREARQTAPGKPRTPSQAKNLVELFANSPFKGLNIEFERDRDCGREIEW